MNIYMYLTVNIKLFLIEPSNTLVRHKDVLCQNGLPCFIKDSMPHCFIKFESIGVVLYFENSYNIQTGIIL
jgi:hypothetical protein